MYTLDTTYMYIHVFSFEVLFFLVKFFLILLIIEYILVYILL